MSSTYLYFKKNIRKRLKKYWRALRGDHFDNAGAVTDEDFRVLMDGIDQAKPAVYLEIGTGKGYSAIKVFNYLQEKFPACDFYTIDIFSEHVANIRARFPGSKTFHAVLGLSVSISETSSPAREELQGYKGPVNVLRDLLQSELSAKKIDIAFIDSRKGSALPEFFLVEKHLSKNGIIFCHDILNRGKGVEVLLYLQQHKDRYEFDVLDTGPAGMIRIRLK